MTKKLKTNAFSKTAFLLAVFFLLSQTAVKADPEHLGSEQDLRPGISPSDVHLSDSNPLPDGSLSDGNPLTPVQGDILTPAEQIHIQDLIAKLPLPVTDMNGTAGNSRPLSPIEVVEKTIENLQHKMDESSKSGNNFIKPYSIFPELKQEDNILPARKTKSLDRDDAETQEREPSAAAEALPVIPPGKVILDMKLEVTPEVVKAAENLNFSTEHPWFGWLALKGISEEVKEIVAKAETQRQVMLETAKEAEKNGKKIVFIANKKVLSFYFNAPLFIEGDYQLLILDDSADLTPQISLE